MGIPRVPFVMQMEMLECGAASLSMILAYYGKWVPLEKLRIDCGVSRNGSTARNIAQAAKKHGLDCKGFRGSLETLKKASFPCIIFWNRNHFVVLNGFTEKHAHINDPAIGFRKVPMEEFEHAYSNIYLVFEKTTSFQPEGTAPSVLHFIKTNFRGLTVPFLFTFLTGLMISILNIVNPALFKIFLDRVLSTSNPSWLYTLVGCMAAVTVLILIVSSIQALYLLKIKGKLAIVSNARFFLHLLRLPVPFFSQRMPGYLAMTQGQNDAIADTLISIVAPVFSNLLLLIVYLVIMIHFSLILTAIGVFAVFLQVMLSFVLSNHRLKFSRAAARMGGMMGGMTVAGIGMIETLKSSGAENGFFEKWSGYQASLNTLQNQFTKSNILLLALPDFIASLASVFILFSGAYLIIQNHFTIGILLMFQNYMAAFQAPVGTVITAGQSIQEMRTAMERVNDVYHYEQDMESEDADELADFEKLSGNIEIRNLSFGYAPLDPPLIKNFDLKIKQGAKVALVGGSGCGKSTLAKLIAGLYTPFSGEILFDGKEKKDIAKQVFTSSLAVVNQDIFVFEGTISDNITMWDRSIEDFEVIMACRDAGIHHTILSRADGYARRVLTGGTGFSGGELQRMEIARALAMDPTILILDEATSALDAKTEFEVTKSISDRGITCIVIAHRLSTIRDCDEIIVLDKGEVVERGTHDALMKLNNFYTKLVATE